MMLEMIIPIAYICLLLITVLCLALATFHALKMYGEIDSRKQSLANILPFLVGILPGFLTPAGEKSRKLFARYLLVGVFCGASAAAIIAFGER